MIDDFNDEDFSHTYGFSCQHGTSTLIKQEVYEDGTSWPVILESFLHFLEASGYVGVLNKVRIEKTFFTESSWTLETYDDDAAAW